MSEFVSNEEYLERWESAGKWAGNGKPVLIDEVPEMTSKEVEHAQGTRNSEESPWLKYDGELDLNDPVLQEAIDEYSKRVSDAEASSQTKDELARVREASLAAAEQYQWVTPEEYKNAGDRIGRIMHSDVFINKLRNAGVKCWYRPHPQPRKLTLIVQVNNEPPKVGCWVQMGHMPELSVMRFDDHGVPLDEKYRGWRTCLLQLILHGIITQERAEDVFGKAAVTPAFHRYNATLQRFRSSGSKLI